MDAGNAQQNEKAEAAGRVARELYGPWLAEAGPGLNDPLLDEPLSIVAPRIVDGSDE